MSPNLSKQSSPGERQIKDDFMDSKKIRQTFFDFFASKEHRIVSSAPIVNKGDPSLLFTNAGMNQFKDFFLGNQQPPVPRMADTQKCLRVSGKHNDLEEVGVDSYHHTMFEMLGNWSFGDYFKAEAIAWAWELLTKVYKLDPNRLYATTFGGDTSEGLSADVEAEGEWSNWIDSSRILSFGKKDNFWEMGDTGPCGPCSEIHIDLRSDEDRKRVPASDLVNQDHPLVVEIWNLVFIQYNRLQDGTLEELPAKHVDTGMGFERLCMALQGRRSNYDTDLFQPYFEHISSETGITYTGRYDSGAKADMAMRVVADHIRAVCCTIADGALPDNTGAGYVVRRILRRAVRYYYSFLDRQEPLLYLLAPTVARQFESVFPEIHQQLDFLQNIIQEEEKSFLRTLALGLRRLDKIEVQDGVVDGHTVFELFDTYGFPIDLTRLIAAEKGWTVDEVGFESALQEQKERSKADAQKSVGDWQILDADNASKFVGYDALEVGESTIIKYRTVATKDGNQVQLVLSKTPFYAEGGGQIGDTGVLKSKQEQVRVINTIKENELIIHIVDRLPSQPGGVWLAEVDAKRRRLIENNHTATHLMHAALRQVLGGHVAQKGSLVTENHLRFDFSHFQKVTSEEQRRIERIVNQKIRENIRLEEERSIPIEEAKKAGAIMLFGEKYGDRVRMVTFDENYSRELCGGCHVPSTGQLGYFKIVSESSVAAGVRRIEAVTALKAEEYIDNAMEILSRIERSFKNPTNLVDQIHALQEEQKKLQKRINQLQDVEIAQIKHGLKQSVQDVGGVNYLSAHVENKDAQALKTLAYQLEKELGNAFIVFGSEINDKPQLLVAISDALTKERGLHAGHIIRDLAKEIKGGGGGQPFFATAGGKDPAGLDAALEKAKTYLVN